MRRERKKGQVIETFSENMVTCEVRFDKDLAMFFAEHATQRFEAPALPQLRQMLKKHSRQYQPAQWEKVILISTSWATEGNHHNAIGVPRGEQRFHRELTLQWHVFERALAPREPGETDEVWWVRSADPHPIVLERRKLDAFEGVSRMYRSYWDDENLALIPFTEAALKSVEAIAAGLSTLNDRLRELLSKDTAEAFLNAGLTMGRLLTTGADDATAEPATRRSRRGA